MQISGLSRFIEIAEAGSYYQAAKLDGEFSSQAYAKVVSSLEQELGAQLVEASRRGVDLTLEGEMLLEYARKTIDGYNDLQSRLKARRPSAHAKPPVVYATFYAATVITELVLHGSIPEGVQVLEEPLDALVARVPYLRENEIALVDIQDGKGSSDLGSKNLSFKCLAECRPVVLVAKGSPLAQLGRNLSVSDLQNAQVLCNSHPEMLRKYDEIINLLPEGTGVNRFSNANSLWGYLKRDSNCAYLADSLQSTLLPKVDASTAEQFEFLPFATSYRPAKLGFLRVKREKKTPEATELMSVLSEVISSLSV